MTKRVLVTGFEPFLDFKVNPSQMIAEKLDGTRIREAEFIGRLLPVDYQDIENVLMKHIRDVSPDLIIGTGLAAGRTKLSVEKLAVNFKYSNEFDNRGNKETGFKIDSDMPDGIFSLLDVERLTEILNVKGVPAEISMTAGTYLCNYAMFVIIREASKRSIKGGFIHVPADTTLATLTKGRSFASMSLDLMVKGVRIVSVHELEDRKI